MSRLEDIGLRLSKPPAEFRRVRHIEFFEGPLISEFQAIPVGEPYFFIWRARDDEYNRWLVIRTSKRDITLYESRETTLRLMIERAVQAFLVDVDTQGVFRRWWATVFEHLPASYIPDIDSFYDPEFRPPGTKDRKRGLSVLIDGQWELKDISEYTSKLRDVYSAEYLLSVEARTGPRESLFDYLLKGGYAYNAFFVGLSKTIPPGDQIELKTFQYASPGIIEMELNEDVASSVTRRVLELSENIDEAREIASEIYRWHIAQDKDTQPRKPIASDEQVSVMLGDLTELMGFIDLGRLNRLTDNDLAQTAKIVLACYRRIVTLVEYHMQGKAKLVAELPINYRDNKHLGGDDHDEDKLQTDEEYEDLDEWGLPVDDEDSSG